MGKHTDAPWMIEPINDGDTYQITTTDRKPYRFAILAETTGGTEEDKANAILMALAPELLEILEDLICVCEEKIAPYGGSPEFRKRIESHVRLARKIAARAKGE